jgi:hypothetical protein
MFAQLVRTYHLHPIVDHFTIALLTFGIAAEILAAAAILLSRDRAGFVSAWGPTRTPENTTLSTCLAVSVSLEPLVRRALHREPVHQRMRDQIVVTSFRMRPLGWEHRQWKLATSPGREDFHN